MKAQSVIVIGSLLLTLAAIGCAETNSAPTDGPQSDQPEKQPEGDASIPPVKVSVDLSGCSQYRPRFDAPVAGSETCGDPRESAVASADRTLYLSRNMRSHIVEATPFVGLGVTVLHGVVFDAIVGTALSTVGLGSWNRGFDYTFDANTGFYAILAKSGLVLGGKSLGTWDAKNAKGELRFRVYWGAGARAGQPVLADIFQPSSYLVEPKLSVDFSTGKVSVSFKSAGPLVSLLGWGDAPTSPVVVSASDGDHVRENTRALLADAHVAVALGQPDCAYTSLELASATRPLGDWAGSDVTLDFVSGGSERKTEIPERITIASFGAKMSLSGDWTEGPVHFTSTRRGLEGDMVMQPRNTAPDMTVTCH
jgi:hypothetical protein